MSACVSPLRCIHLVLNVEGDDLIEVVAFSYNIVFYIYMSLLYKLYSISSLRVHCVMSSGRAGDKTEKKHKIVLFYTHTQCTQCPGNRLSLRFISI